MKFDTSYYAISNDSDPVIMQVMLACHTTRRYVNLVEEEFKCLIIWQDDGKDHREGEFIAFDGWRNIFKTLSEAMLAKHWLLEVPGRSLYNYDKPQYVF